MNIVIQLSFRFGPHSHRIPGNPSDPSGDPFARASPTPLHRLRLHRPASSRPPAALAPYPRGIEHFGVFRPLRTPRRVYTTPCLLLVYLYIPSRRRNTVRSRPPGLCIHIYMIFVTAPPLPSSSSSPSSPSPPPLPPSTHYIYIYTYTRTHAVILSPFPVRPTHTQTRARPMTERRRRRCRSLILLGKCNL